MIDMNLGTVQNVRVEKVKEFGDFFTKTLRVTITTPNDGTQVVRITLFADDADDLILKEDE